MSTILLTPYLIDALSDVIRLTGALEILFRGWTSASVDHKRSIFWKGLSGGNIKQEGNEKCISRNEQNISSLMAGSRLKWLHPLKLADGGAIVSAVVNQSLRLRKWFSVLICSAILWASIHARVQNAIVHEGHKQMLNQEMTRCLVAGSQPSNFLVYANVPEVKNVPFESERRVPTLSEGREENTATVDPSVDNSSN
ncbi:hypothetical protein CEXT_371401 [Caerostris extrusa]|uniref:Uncharacterized protein n=1 Tax=Caerostris extrusa TaxID=172846 RepID=A0AAV4TK19_CAEEX|nr:hypothetical protein CEXT_371401 [Caerostris extrusa]